MQKKTDQEVNAEVNGGAFAFNPDYEQPGEDQAYPLTKREYFAGLAMQGMLANGAVSVGALLETPGLATCLGNDATAFADGLLLALEQPKTKIKDETDPHYTGGKSL